MFLFEKYRPTKISEFRFNRDIMEKLISIASNEDIPHIIISGPAGSGKKTIVNKFLESLYDKNINNLSRIKYSVSGSSTKKDVEILQSDYHIIIESTNTNHDKYILQEIIKRYAMHKSFNIFQTNRKFKTIVIHNIENLSNNSQAALRRTMELYAKSCRFVMVCNNLSKVFDPLRSRCITFCVSSPSRANIEDVVSYIAFMEQISLSNEKLNFILENCQDKLKRAIWMLDAIRLDSESSIQLDSIFSRIVELMIEVKPTSNVIKIFDEIRDHVYTILISNINGSEIITVLLDQLLQKIDDFELGSKIIAYASKAENNMVHGRRPVIHTDYFASGVIKELIMYQLSQQDEKKVKKPISRKNSKANMKS